jgi:hypothetical protein
MVKYFKTKKAFKMLKHGEKKRNKKTKTRKTKTRKTKTMIGGGGGEEKSIEQSQLEDQLKQAGKYDEWVSKGSKFGRPKTAGDSFSIRGTYLDMDGNEVKIDKVTGKFNKFKDNEGYIPVFLQPEDKPEPQNKPASWWDKMFGESPPPPSPRPPPPLYNRELGGNKVFIEHGEGFTR